MKKTITRQYTMIFAILLIVVMFVSVLANYLFLEHVYQRNKQNRLVETLNFVNDATAEGGADGLANISEDLTNVCAKSNITMVIMTSDYQILFSTGAETDILQKRFTEVWFGGWEDVEILTQKDNYTLEKTSDKHRDGGYLILFGTLDDGNSILMQIPLSSIEESADISRQFMIYICVAAAIVGAILIYLIARRLTHPIMELTDLSKRMTELDFTAKYSEDRHNNYEINQLGYHMNELSEALEHTISELKTANNEMKLDLDRKEQIDEMRKEFLSNVSHELKTPIALIQGYAEGLEEYADDPENRAFYTEVIIDEAHKMNILVQKLLTLNQLEFGTDEVSMEHFDLDELIRGVVSNMTIMLQQEGITLRYAHTGALYVWADQFKTEEVLTNYLSNAIHHIDGDRVIEVGVEMRGETVRISVYNTGKCLPDEELRKLWDKFYKVDKSHSRQYGGSGIGLSIVKAIMESFHQDFGVHNRENGVEFWFELDASKH